MNIKIYGYEPMNYAGMEGVRNCILSAFPEIDDLVVTVVNSDVRDRAGKKCPYLEVVDDKLTSIEMLYKLRALAKDLGLDIEVAQPLVRFISK